MTADLRDMYEANPNRFGSFQPLTHHRTEHGIIWTCLCVCGRQRDVRQRDLLSNRSRSCGCQTAGYIVTARQLPEGASSLNDLFRRYQRSAIRTGREWGLTINEFRVITSQPCYLCGVPPLQVWHAPSRGQTNGVYIYNGIDRVDNAVGYIHGNVEACCEYCNKAKRTMSLGEFREWLYRAATHQGFVAKQGAHT